MTTTARSFTVFVDSPTSEASEPKVTVTTRRLTRSLSESSIPTTVLSLVATTDKENLDPLTGERVGFTTASGKKRKGSISVLAVKPSTLAELKLLKEKDVSEAQPEPKKRRSTISSTPNSKAKKEPRVSSSAKKGKRSSRRPSPMPKLDEESELDKEQLVTQAQIDSKCYDLTVKPLADVSEAYDQEGESPESPTQEQDVFHFVKVGSLLADVGFLY